MKTNKERLYLYMQEVTGKKSAEFSGFTTQELAEQLHLQRSNISALLNALVKEKRIVKINGRPVYYQLRTQSQKAAKDVTCFQKLIGYDGSLKNAVQLAKAGVHYPAQPMMILIAGQRGTGKSYFASLMHEYAVSQKLLAKDAPFVQFDCSFNSEDGEEDLMEDLFDSSTGSPSLVDRARRGVLLLDHIDRIKPKAKRQLFQRIENGEMAEIMLICTLDQYESRIIPENLQMKFPVQIELPSLKQRRLAERMQLVQKFFISEAEKMQKDIKVSSELLRCFLLYYCEGNIKQIRNDIQVGCANAYVRALGDESGIVNIYMYDCPPYVRKGFLFYKEYRFEIESLISENFTYIFSEGSIQRIEGLPGEQEGNLNSIYDMISKKANDLREHGIEESDIARIISSDMEEEINRIKVHTGEHIDKESLAKIVGAEIFAFVDDFLKEATETFHRTYSLTTFYSLCLYIFQSVNKADKLQKISNERIFEVMENCKEEYALCIKYMRRIEESFHATLSIDEVVLITMLISSSTVEDKTKTPVLLVAMHGTIASSVANVVKELLNIVDAYAYDLLLDKDMNEAYDELKQYCQQIDRGAGILVLCDMGSISSLIETVMQETGIPTRVIELPVTLTALDAAIKVRESSDLETAYQNMLESSTVLNRSVQDNYRKGGEYSKVIVTLCASGRGAAAQVKRYLEINMDLADTEVVALSFSNQKALLKSIDRIRESGEIQCIVGTYNPQLYEIPFIPILRVFETPVERLPMLLLLESSDMDYDVNYEEIYEYLKEQQEALDINKIRRHLLPAIRRIKKLVNNYSVELEVGLFIHIASAINRIKSGESMPANMRKDYIIGRNKKLYNDLKEILSSLENAMDFRFGDDELSIIIEIIK